MRANERADERVAQYFSLYSWLLSTIVPSFPPFQARLLPMRERFKAQEERDVEKMTKIKLGGPKAALKGTANGDKAVEKTKFPHAFPDDVGSNNSG